MNLKWKFIYLGRRPSLSPLLNPDVLADVDVVDLKLSIICMQLRTCNIGIWPWRHQWTRGGGGGRPANVSQSTVLNSFESDEKLERG